MKEAGASGRVALAQKLNDQMQKLEEQAAAFSIPNEFGATLSQAGAAGLNATTSHDATRYFMAMPANKLELWFALEAERFRVSHGASMVHNQSRKMMPSLAIRQQKPDHIVKGSLYLPQALHCFITDKAVSSTYTVNSCADRHLC